MTMKKYRTIIIVFGAFLLILIGAFVQNVRAAVGVPKILSYQGRLLNATGNLLGGSGTPYCFLFSLFNASSGGSQVWPAATASIMTATVANGVFNIGVGDTSAGGDALTYNFQDSDAVYLNVQVATKVDPVCTGGAEVFETLTPRERVVASGYAINSYAVGGFTAGTNASGTMIPVISSDTLTLAGVNPQINATGTNTLTLQGGAGTGAIQFFSSSNYVNSSTFRMNGMVSANALQMAVAPTQSANLSLVALGQLPVRLGSASGTYIGVNTAGTFNGDYLEFENNSSTVFTVASSGQLTIGTSTNVANSLFVVAGSSNLFTVFTNGNANLLGALNVTSTLSVGSSTNFLGNTSIGTSSEPSLFTIATSSNILTVLANGNIGIATTTPGSALTVAGTSYFSATSSFMDNLIIGGGGSLQLTSVPNPSTNLSLLALGQSFVRNGSPSGTYFGINTSGTYNGDFLEFENNSSTVLNIASSGQLTIGTSTNATNSLFAVATSSNIFTVLNNGNVGIGTTTPSALLQVAGAEALGVASSTIGKLLFYNSNTSSSVTLQGSTSTAQSITFILPNSTGTAGQSLVTDGNGNLSWGSTGFTVIASTSVNKVLVTTMASDTTAGITPSNLNSQVWITANVMASTTAATSSVGIGVFKTAACGTLVGSVVTSTFARATTTVPGVYNMTLNVVDSPASTTKQNYWLCADYAGNVANLSYAEITLQEVRAGSDVAEVYFAATGTPITAGDVVSLDPTIQDGVQQSQSAYDGTTMGVISTQPGAVLGSSDASPGVQELVALAGRVPIHVTNANGNIAVGDYLTASDIPGVAMRATKPGRMVAVAMQSFAPDAAMGTTTGSILAFMNLGWSPGNQSSSTASTSSSMIFSIGDDLQHFFGIVADAGNVIQGFIRASMVAVQNLFVKTVVVLPSGSITVPSGENQISGQGVLEAGETDVFVANTSVTSSSEIMVTPTSLTANPLSVIDIKDGSGFDVGVANPPVNSISFTWFVVGTYGVGSTSIVQSSGNGSVPAPSAAPPIVASVVPVTVDATSSDSSSTDATSSNMTDATNTTNTTYATDTTDMTNTSDTSNAQ